MRKAILIVGLFDDLCRQGSGRSTGMLITADCSHKCNSCWIG